MAKAKSAHVQLGYSDPIAALTTPRDPTALAKVLKPGSWRFHESNRGKPGSLLPLGQIGFKGL